MVENRGCYWYDELMECSFMKGKGNITLKEILKSEIPLKDKYWFVCKKLLTKKQNVKLAIGVATLVLHLFEERYQKDNRPRKAIEAAKKYFKNKNVNSAAAMLLMLQLML